MKTQQILLYRLKKTAEVRQIVIETLEVIATPTTWKINEQSGQKIAIAWYVELHINSTIIIDIHDTTDYHEFITVEV